MPVLSFCGTGSKPMKKLVKEVFGNKKKKNQQGFETGIFLRGKDNFPFGYVSPRLNSGRPKHIYGNKLISKIWKRGGSERISERMSERRALICCTSKIPQPRVITTHVTVSSLVTTLCGYVLQVTATLQCRFFFCPPGDLTSLTR